MGRPSRHGVVSLAALDVRLRPDHRAELGSQLLLGEVARLLRRSADRRWWEAENLADGYRGWVRDWGLIEVSRAGAARWLRKARARVGALFVEVREGRGAGPLLTPLPWNARVIALGLRGRFRRIELPDGRRGWVPRSAVGSAGSGPGILRRVRTLLGVPYFWGGRTPLGFDCSGFTQQVLAEHGISVARDAAEQQRHAKRLGKGENPRLGDLVFFGAPGRPVGHVGLGLGGSYYAHCRRAVRINSVDPINRLYDNELAVQMRGWARPSGRPS